MKKKLFVIVPIAVVLAVLLGGCAVFALPHIGEAESIEQDEADNMFVPGESWTITSHEGEELELTYMKQVSYSSDEDPVYLYDTGDNFLYEIADDGEICSMSAKNTLAIPLDRTNNITEEQGIKIAEKILSEDKDSEGLVYQGKEADIFGSTKYEFSPMCGDFVLMGGGSVTLRDDGKVANISYPRELPYDDFDPTLVDGVTAEMVYADCDEKIEGVFEITTQRIRQEKETGRFYVSSFCRINIGNGPRSENPEDSIEVKYYLN